MFDEYSKIKDEMKLVYLHDQRPWMIGFSGGKDSTLLCQLVFEMDRIITRRAAFKACIRCYFGYNGGKSDCKKIYASDERCN